MINYGLPKSVYIDDEEYHINCDGDFRMILDVISVINDSDLTDQEKAICALNIFYDFNIPKDTQKAIDEMMKFINCGAEDKKKDDKPPLMDWEKDFNLIIAPLNKALGYETRAKEYLHWWTFIAGYMEIDSECTFSTVVKIRRKKQKHQKLDKAEQKFYEENRDMIDLPIKYTQEEEELFNKLLGNND